MCESNAIFSGIISLCFFKIKEPKPCFNGVDPPGSSAPIAVKGLRAT